MPVLDSPLLQSTLRDELRAAWIKIHAEHAAEQLYGFGVFTTDSASYLTVTAFSERGLDAAVARYLASKRGQGSDPALQRQALRWSSADSPLHAVGSGLLPTSDKIVNDLDLAGHGLDDEDENDGEDDEDDDDFDDEPIDPEVEEVFQVAVQVLRELDQQGLFGIGAERERLVLGLWKGDQSNLERHAYAKALNPPAVARRFGDEMNIGLRAFYQLYMPGEPLPEDDVFD